MCATTKACGRSAKYNRLILECISLCSYFGIIVLYPIKVNGWASRLIMGAVALIYQRCNIDRNVLHGIFKTLPENLISKEGYLDKLCSTSAFLSAIQEL